MSASVWFGPATSKVVAPCAVPGLSWFFVRLSAPEWKWQLAQAWMPSLPTCMSQKSALPSAMAAGLLRTKRARLEGSGTGTVLSEGGGGGRTWAPAGAPRSAPARAAASNAGNVRFMTTSPQELYRGVAAIVNEKIMHASMSASLAGAQQSA